MVPRFPPMWRRQKEPGRIIPPRYTCFCPVQFAVRLAYGSILVPSKSRNFFNHSGCAGQAGAVTRFSCAWA